MEWRNSLPPGYRFNPTDTEKMDLLKMKTVDRDDSVDSLIPTIDNLGKEPCEIFSMLTGGSNDKECWFFSPRKRKYPRSDRADRCTRAGHWKPTGKRPKILTLGIKRRLTFYQGRPHPRKTGYIMHQYELSDRKEFTLCCLKRSEDEESKNRGVNGTCGLHTLQDNGAEDATGPEQEANQELFIPPLQSYGGIDFGNMSSFDQRQLHDQHIQQEANQELVFQPSQMYGDMDIATLNFEQNILDDQLPDQDANQSMLVEPSQMHASIDSTNQNLLKHGESREDLNRLIDSFINFSPESPMESDFINESIPTGLATDGGEVINK